MDDAKVFSRGTDGVDLPFTAVVTWFWGMGIESLVLDMMSLRRPSVILVQGTASRPTVTQAGVGEKACAGDVTVGP